MLARLQRRAILMLALAALAWWLGWQHAGHAILATAGAFAIIGSYPIVLAIEFALLAAIHGDDPTPHASALELLRAWLRECVVAQQVFGWRQPFRAGAHADVSGRRGQRGIVFVHGYLCNRGVWNPWLVRCAARGVPCVAVSLEPVFGELDVYIPQLEQAIARLEHETGAAPLLVCHSMGGLVARAWLAATPGAAARVRHVVTVATPHRGTWLARLGRTTNALHMRQASGWLQRLAAREPACHAECYTCFYGQADNIVLPPRAATLEGADNRHLRASAHLTMVYHPEVFSEVDRWLATSDAASSVTAALGERSP